MDANIRPSFTRTHAVPWPWPHGIHHVTVDDITHVREIFGPTDDRLRAAKSAVFYTGLEARQRLPQGMHDRGEEYVIANGTLHPRDAVGLACHAPFHAKVIHVPFHHIRAGETWNISVRHTAWPGLDHMEELYVALRIDHLVLSRGARLIVQGNVLYADVGVIEREHPAAPRSPLTATSYDIGVLPTPFSVDRPTSPHKGHPGAPGHSGATGRDGTAVRVMGSVLGPYIPDDSAAPSTSRDGGKGQHGHNGDPGQRGPNGGMCKMADLCFSSLRGFQRTPLRLFTQAGTGGAGGYGGAGGHGGNGGKGGTGAYIHDTVLAPGFGGMGGDGGQGGSGGQGGNGGLSSNIFVTVNPRDYERIVGLSLPSLGGPGGQGGAGGMGGGGGSCGDRTFRVKATTHPSTPGHAPDGAPGQPGQAGRDGSPRPRAHIFLFTDGQLKKCLSHPVF